MICILIGENLMPNQYYFIQVKMNDFSKCYSQE